MLVPQESDRTIENMSVLFEAVEVCVIHVFKLVTTNINYVRDEAILMSSSWCAQGFVHIAAKHTMSRSLHQYFVRFCTVSLLVS